MADAPHPRSYPAWTKPLRSVGRGIVTAVLIGYAILDAILKPLLRPLHHALGQLSFFAVIGSALARLPPYVAMLALAVPFVILEPLKVFALYWFGIGHFIQGGILLVLAHGGSILIVDRLYHAMHEPLMRIGWFKRLMTWLYELRCAALDWAKASAMWKASARLAADVTAAVRGWFRARA
jgi:hypothetical protein